MIEKFQDWLTPKIGSDRAYYATITLYMTLMIIALSLNGWLFDNWHMVIIGSIVINCIRQYTSGYHEHYLTHCIILTNALFLIFGYIAKQSIGNLWVVFLLTSLFCIKDVYVFAPLTETDYPDKSAIWHKERAIAWIIIFILIAILCIYLGYVLIAKNILLSIVMVDLLLFKNQKRV